MAAAIVLSAVQGPAVQVLSVMTAPAVEELPMTSIARPNFDSNSRVGSFNNNRVGSFTHEDTNNRVGSFTNNRVGSFTGSGTTSNPGSFCNDANRPGNSWMRMRTPSPVTPGYPGADERDPPLPPGTLLKLGSTMLQQPYMALKASVSRTRMPWRAQADNNPSADCGYTDGNAEAPPARASTDSRRDFGENRSFQERPIGENRSFQERPVGENRSFQERPIGENFSFQDRPAVRKITEEMAPSKGSIGHPDCCAEACKYHKKAKGCKDGLDCDRCHICVYRAIKPKKKNEDCAQCAPTIDVQSASPIDASAPPPKAVSARVKRRAEWKQNHGWT